MFVDRSETSAVKLTDFGLAAMFTEGGPPLTEVLGSAYYVAPEVLREAYSKEADVWSTGVVLFIALGGYAPFDGANEREVCEREQLAREEAAQRFRFPREPPNPKR